MKIVFENITSKLLCSSPKFWPHELPTIFNIVLLVNLLLIYSGYFTNVAAGKTATNNLIKSFAIITIFNVASTNSIFVILNRACLIFLCKYFFYICTGNLQDAVLW